MLYSEVRRGGVAKLATWLVGLSNVLLVVVPAFMALPEEKVPKEIRWAVVFANERGWLVIILAALAIPAIPWLQRRWHGHPKLLPVLDEVLSAIRTDAFEKTGGLQSNNRVTLFAHRRFYLAAVIRRGMSPWGGWLVPARRYGHISQRSKTLFRAPDDGSKAEGIAGQAWVNDDKVASVMDLPPISRDSDEEELRKYAKETFVDVKQLKKVGQFSKSIVAFAVQRADGDRWGVLVLDSSTSNIGLEQALAEWRRHAKVVGGIVDGL